METIQKIRSPILSYFLILLSFFILLFFTRGYFTELQAERDTKEQLSTQFQEKELKLSDLNAVQLLISQDGSEEMKIVSPFLVDFSEASILEYIYSYAQKVNLTNERMIIRDLSLSENGISDIGFDSASVNLSAVFSSEDTMFAFLNYMTRKEGAYRFYIEQFEYPMNANPGNIQVSIPLTLYYKK